MRYDVFCNMSVYEVKTWKLALPTGMRLNSTSPYQIADDIWNLLRVGQRVELLSFTNLRGNWRELGEVVVELMENNWKRTRIRGGQIGNPWVGKSFRWERIVNENELKWVIWRLQ